MEKKNERGSMTVEVLIALTIFVMAFIVLMNYINAVRIQGKIQQGLTETAKEIAAFSSYATKGNSTGSGVYGIFDTYRTIEKISGHAGNDNYIHYSLVCQIADDPSAISYCGKALFEENMRDSSGSIDYLEQAGVANGIHGMSFENSSYDVFGDGTLRLTVTYRYRIIPIPFFRGGGINVTIAQNVSTRLWNTKY